MRPFALVLVAACSIPAEHYTPGDGGGEDASACWSLTQSNFDPCAADFPAMMPDFTMTQNETLDTTQTKLIDTDGNTSTTFGTLYISTDSTTVLLVHVHSFTMGAGLNLHVQGMHPVLVVSETTIDISGTIDYTKTLSPIDDDCMDKASMAHPFAPGGTGGGFGGDGGKGGDGDGTTYSAPAADAANGTNDLSPLRAGCDGAKGAMGSGAAGGDPGKAGGAIELSAHDGVFVSHLISADGGGGGAGTAGDTTHDGGGGGGGSGGAILLEAPTILLNGASLCAVGGGGGPGGLFGALAMNGTDGGGCMPGVGGVAGVNGAPGGAGGVTGAGTAGGSHTGAGGGGGGGAAGRVVFHGAVTKTGIVIERPPAVSF